MCKLPVQNTNLIGTIIIIIRNLCQYGGAVSLGMEVYGYDPYVSVNAAWNLSRSVKHVTNVEEIYADCDYITIHVPLLDSTKGMINKEAISKMKDGVVLLNFARDLLANEADVLEALKSGKVARYVSDFPNPTTAGQPGCIVIPHLGASTEESESLSQAQRLKKLSQEGGCTLDAMCEVMNEIKKDELDHVTIKNEVLRKYFPKSYTPKQMQDTIIRLLEKWQRSKQRDMER